MMAVSRALIAAGVAVLLLVLPSLAEAGGDDDGLLLAQRARGRRGGRGGTAPTADARSLVRGHVVTADPATGRVALEIGGTIVEATFNPARAKELTPGDVVFVTVDLIDTRIATISGAVTAVDPATGTLTVATPRGALTVTASPENVAAIHSGDTVLLKLDVVDIGPPFEPSLPPPNAPPTSNSGR